MKKNQLGFTQILSVSLMLFAIFFGAGNMIFPPALGAAAANSYISAVFGFITTDAGLAILGMVAVVLVGSQMSDLGALVGKKFSYILPIGVYLLIGPLFALPRTGSVSYELVILPFFEDSSSQLIYSLGFTAVFFFLTYWLSSNPKKIVDIIGKVLTPLLLLAIALIFIASLLYPLSDVGLATNGYEANPFFKGMIEGYLALDGPAGLAFSVLIIQALKNYGVKEKKSLVKYTVVCGMIAGAFLSVVYLALAYVGAHSSALGTFTNGGKLLTVVTYELFGNYGQIVLGLAMLFACLTTSIGLTTSFSEYFNHQFPKISYKTYAKIVCIFSFVISNVGLSSLIKISLPVLIAIYPVTIVLIVLSYMKNKIGERKSVYICGMLFTFVVAGIEGLYSLDISLGVLTQFVTSLPFYELGLGWILPAIIGSLIGWLPIFTKKSHIA